ncbi:MAG: FAD-dependent monooxygenase [Cyanobacteria bacterium P01_G01_bin.39]
MTKVKKNSPKSLGDEPKAPLRDRVIVIGGSIAGLISARVLADYFQQVIIIERDELSSTPQARRGVPQSVQPHVLLTKGYRLLEEFFPGIEAKLRDNAALSIDWGQEFHHYFEKHWGIATPEPSDIVSVTCSRYLLEWIIRQELIKLPKIEIRQQSKVTGLVYDAASSQVRGVQLNEAEQINADLVVDASGRSSQANQWLKEIGQTPAPETIINPFLGYATRRYRLPGNFEPNWKVLLISQTPPHDTRLGYLARIENDELIATLGGYGKDFPPLDDRGFLEFAHSLAQPDFYQAIANATPTSPIYAHRATANRRRNYEQIKLPAGIIALGDAVCALCPVYGQGMTVSALGAKTLQAWLAKSSATKLDNNRFQQQLAKSNSLHWTLATSQDSRFPGTVGAKQGQPSILDKIMTGYMNRLLSKSTVEPSLHLKYLEVAHSLRSPLSLYHPQVMWQVLT